MLEDAARRYGLIALAAALLFALCLSENGLFGYLKLRSRIAASEASIGRLQEENAALRSELERLRKDDRYFEDVARKRFGFIREGEKVYRIEK